MNITVPGWAIWLMGTGYLVLLLWVWGLLKAKGRAERRAEFYFGRLGEQINYGREQAAARSVNSIMETLRQDDGDAR